MPITEKLRILAKKGPRRVERAIDPIPPNARERSRVLFDRLVDERLKRGSDIYRLSGKQVVTWEVEFHTKETYGEIKSSSFFRLRRNSIDGRGWLLHDNPGIRTAETFTIYPWFVCYSDFTSLPYEYLHLNSAKTLDAAEKTMAFLFPVDAETGTISVQSSQVLE